MKDHLTLDATPADEKCIGINHPDYETLGRLECQVYRRQLIRMFKAEHHVDKLPEGCELKIRGNNHEYGVYHEVSVTFDDSLPASVDAAFWFDANIPAHWDNEAKMELQELIPSPITQRV